VPADARVGLVVADATSRFAGPVPSDPPSRADPWLAQDKARHFAMSFAATTFAYAGARTALDPDAAAVASVAVATAAGVAKEIRDARVGAWFSLRDMVWNLGGAALGFAFVHQIR
jgi:uncharacterized protein YfiM (DUF2279 family)